MRLALAFAVRWLPLIMRRFAPKSRAWQRGQTAVEYLMTTMALVTFFAGMYAFLQGQVRRLFVLAATKILTSYR